MISTETQMWTPSLMYSINAPLIVTEVGGLSGELTPIGPDNPPTYPRGLAPWGYSNGIKIA